MFAFNAKLSSPSVKDHEDSCYAHMAIKQYFKIGSNVILRKNLWKEAGLFNGSKGVLKDVILNDDDSLRCLLIEFENFKGEGWNGTNLVPIEVMEIYHEKSTKHFRELAPVDLSDALTVYKVQG